MFRKEKSWTVEFWPGTQYCFLWNKWLSIEDNLSKIYWVTLPRMNIRLPGMVCMVCIGSSHDALLLPAQAPA